MDRKEKGRGGQGGEGREWKNVMVTGLHF